MSQVSDLVTSSWKSVQIADSIDWRGRILRFSPY